MSGFSEYLDEYMEEHSISSSELSKDINIDRTTIHRYRKGKRIPVDEETVNLIADSLRMRVHERNTLMERYDREVLGESIVNGYRYVKEMLHAFSMNEKKNDSVAYIWRCEINEAVDSPVIRLNSENEIVSYIHAVFDKAKKNESEVSIIMQPVYSSVMRMIGNVFENCNVRINHIMCIEQNYSRSYKNLEMFRQILPMCFQNNNYNALYYYDALHGHINDMSIMPNIIITDECVVTFDYEMKHGMMIRGAVYRDVMLQQFKKIISKATPFVCAENDQIEVADGYNVVSEARNPFNLVGVFYQTCMGACVSSDIYGEYLYPFQEKNEFIRLMNMRMGDWDSDGYHEGTLFFKGGVCVLSDPQGIRSFMESGRVDEFPAGYYREFDMNTRKIVLSRLIRLVKKGYVTCRFIMEDIDIPKQLFFYIDTDEKDIIIQKVNEGGTRKVIVKEPGIFQAFMNFVEYLEKKNKLCEGEDAIRVLEEIEREYAG